MAAVVGSVTSIRALPPRDNGPEGEGASKLVSLSVDGLNFLADESRVSGFQPGASVVVRYRVSYPRREGARPITWLQSIRPAAAADMAVLVD